MHVKTSKQNGWLLILGTLKVVGREDHILLLKLCASFSIFLHILKCDASVPLAFNMSVALRWRWDWQSCLFFSSSWIHVAQEQQTTNNSYRSTNHNHFVLNMKNIENKRKKKKKVQNVSFSPYQVHTNYIINLNIQSLRENLAVLTEW